MRCGGQKFVIRKGQRGYVRDLNTISATFKDNTHVYRPTEILGDGLKPDSDKAPSRYHDAPADDKIDINLCTPLINTALFFFTPKHVYFSTSIHSF